MKLIRTEDAVGHVLCHDMTQIIKDVSKGPRFRKGHVVTEEDIPVLLDMGKEHLYVWEMDESMLHEDEAAEILKDISIGEHMGATAPKEGKISLTADVPSVLKIRRDSLRAVNSLGEVMIASKRGDSYIGKGQVFAGMRVIPLIISKEKMELARKAAGDEPIFSLIPLKKKKCAIITTGSEVEKGRISDTFTPVVEEKISSFGSSVIRRELTGDDAERTAQAILSAVNEGAELVCVTGGMSVDPDDRTPLAIKKTGADIVTYGAPVLPGAMFMLAYLHVEGRPAAVPVVGLPGCVMYSKRTVFDMILPRLLADDPVTAEEIAGMGEGGLL